MCEGAFLAIGSEDGRIPCGSQCIGTRYFHGDIDEVFLFRRALSPEEVNALFVAGAEMPSGTDGGKGPPRAPR